MKPSDLVVQVHEREYERLQRWVAGYLDWRDAQLYGARAMVAMWTQAVRDQGTKHGPIEFMQSALIPRIRRMREVRSSYLPVAAPFTIALPSDTELNELADAYSLVQVTSACFDTEWTQRTDMQAWLYEVIQPARDVVQSIGKARAILAGERLVEAGRRVLDDGTATELDAYGWRETCRRQELDRSRKWLIRATMAQRGQIDVPKEEVHDLHRHGQDVAEDPLAGSRPTRSPEPWDDSR